MTRVHAFTDDALGDLDAVGLVQRLRSGQVSAAELVEAAVARVEKVNPRLNAVAHEAFDRARREARSTREGWFAGVPTFVKDNCDVAGMPTQHGTDAFRARPSRRDGAFARTYLATGMVPLGKTQLSEFGFNASAEHARLGPVRNPWDTDLTAGASSAGSAALVAAGAVPIAHANDGGGSIRIPAAVNGLVGLKPTRDRLPQDQLFRMLPVRIVADGVVTRSVRDTAAFLREAERVWRNPAYPPVGDVTGPGADRLRVAMLTHASGRDAEPEVREQVLATAELLTALGHHVEEIESPAPDTFADDFLLYWAMSSLLLLRSARVSFGRTWDRTRADVLTLGLERHSLANLRRLPAATRRLADSWLSSLPVWHDHDVVLTPTLAAPTPRLGHLAPGDSYDEVIGRLRDWVAYTPWHNATGEPAVSLPLGRSRDGMPLGMMFGAPRGEEARLLRLAFELEEARPWPRITEG